MPRSLIRLPQLEGASIPANAGQAFVFAEEAGGASIMTFDTTTGANEVVFGSSQTVKILGDLMVMGDRTIVNSEVMTVADSTIVAALPEVKDAEFDSGGGPSTTITVTAAGHGLTASPAGQKFYAITGDAAIPEGIYEVSAVNSVDEFEITLGSAANLSSVEGSISGRIQDTNSDFGGYLIPTESGLVGLQFRESDQDLQLRGKDVNVDENFSVTGNSSLNGNVALGNANTDEITMSGTIQGANALLFDGSSAGNGNRTTLAVVDPQQANTITMPDNTGTMVIDVALDSATAITDGDLGLQISALGELSIDINDISSALAPGSSAGTSVLDAADGFIINDADDENGNNHVIKKTTLGDLQAFLAAGGTKKDSLVVDAQIALSSGNAGFDYSGSAPASQQMDAQVVTAFEAASESSREIYLNGVLMREGSNEDLEVVGGSDLINFKFQLEAGDVVTVVARA